MDSLQRYGCKVEGCHCKPNSKKCINLLKSYPSQYQLLTAPLINPRRAQWSHWSGTTFMLVLELGFVCGTIVTPTGQSDRELQAISDALECGMERQRGVGMCTYYHLCMFVHLLMQTYASVSNYNIYIKTLISTTSWQTFEWIFIWLIYLSMFCGLGVFCLTGHTFAVGSTCFCHIILHSNHQIVNKTRLKFKTKRNTNKGGRLMTIFW